MVFSQTAPRDGEYYQADVAERDPGDGNNSFFGRARTAVEGSDYDGRRRRPKVGATHRSADLDSEQSTPFKPSIAGRAVRAAARFSIVVLIGVGATLALQSSMKRQRSWSGTGFLRLAGCYRHRRPQLQPRPTWGSSLNR